MLEVKDVTMFFVTGSETVKAVDSVGLSVPKGSFLTLLGPSGCGKTTLLRCLAGLEHPSSGTIAIGDQIVYSAADGINISANRRNLGMVFQSYAIWPHMSVYDNVAFPLIIRKEERIKERTLAALSKVGLVGIANRNASRLSGGQQQRVALARATVAEPSLMLLDEPLSNLDASLRDQMRGEIRALQKELGITTICVTHDQNEALSMSDQVALMWNGRILELASPEQLYERPRTVSAAQFIGGANILSGHAFPRPNGASAIETEIGKVISSESATGAVHLFIRPEKIKPFIGDQDESAQQIFDCVVVNRRFIGGQVELDLLPAGAKPRSFLRAKCSSDISCNEGIRISVVVDPDDVHILVDENER
ncbi:MAG: ABC transporter ATP-binding protein [Rhizobiaceae bacterium]|nr:ABC transporter ATP-binding protein [Rhizobiaceae bacterium]